MKKFRLYISIGLLLILAGCSVGVPVNMDQQRNVALEDVRSDMQRKKQRVKMINEPGMIHIQRQTEEYSISMVLDASDENIYFVMDLPKEEEQVAPPVEEPALPEPEPEPEPEQPAQVEPEVEEGEQPEQTAAAEEAPAEEPQEQSSSEEIDETRASKYVLYAQTYFLEKKYARALEEVNRAIGYSPSSAVAHSLRGSIYYKLGEKDLAKGAWTRALELDASLDNVKKMLAQLEQEQK